MTDLYKLLKQLIAQRDDMDRARSKMIEELHGLNRFISSKDAEIKRVRLSIAAQVATEETGETNGTRGKRMCDPARGVE